MVVDELQSGRARASVLVVDDEPDLRTLYELSLLRDGYEVTTADSVGSAITCLSQRSYDVIVSDMRLPDGLGLDVIRFVGEQHRQERCVVITAYGSAENAVEALKAGAFDYLSKPIDLKQFRAAVAQAVNLSSQSRANPAQMHTPTTVTTSRHPSSGDSAEASALDAIVGQSPVMAELRHKVSKVAKSMAPVLVLGESGTGKELVARAIHACSHRCRGPFIAVNCGAIPEHLLEAEFFGARKGAYTGSSADRDGYFQAASGGTLFLDEIGDLPLPMQAKLLRAIQERVVRPIGATQEVQVNARIVSATHRDMERSVASGQFRQDLYYRINVIAMHVPALRERLEDLPELVECLLARISRDSGEAIPDVPESFLHALARMPLRGNVRELENVLHRAVALSTQGTLSLDALPDSANLKRGHANDIGAAQPMPDREPLVVPQDLQASLDAHERAILLQALNDTGYNRTAAAARLGINLRQIRYRMARLGIAPAEGKDA